MVVGRGAEDVVRRFFRSVRSGRLDLVQLFAHNAVVREPPSSSGVLSDRQDIESFLNVALVHNSDMLRRLEIKKAAGGRVSAAVFENGGRTKAVFMFDLDSETKTARLEMAFASGATDPARA